MKIAVIGAGAIGGLVAGYLKLKGSDVVLVGTPGTVKVVKNGGLRISGTRGDFEIKIDITEKLDFEPDLVILATKTQDIEKALKDNLNFLKGVLILSSQNGIQADNLIAKYIEEKNLVSSIVMFGATLLEPGKIVHNFEGSWAIGRLNCKNDAPVDTVSNELNKVFSVAVTPDLKGMKYLKIFVNANNCIPAILGLSMQESFADWQISAISMGIWKEGLEAVRHAGISLVSLPDFPLERLTKLAALPTAAGAKIFSGIMGSLSKEPLYGSILQSIKRRRDSEIDYINGEFVRIGRANNFDAALNRKLVEMVHQVENTGRFFSREDLINQTKGLFS